MWEVAFFCFSLLKRSVVFRQKKKRQKDGGGRGASALTADAPRGGETVQSSRRRFRRRRGETRVHIEKRARDFCDGGDDSDDDDDGSEREGLRASALVSFFFFGGFGFRASACVSAFCRRARALTPFYAPTSLFPCRCTCNTRKVSSLCWRYGTRII